VVHQTTQLAEHNSQPIARLASVARKLAILQKSAEAGHPDRGPSIPTCTTSHPKMSNIHHMASTDPAPLITVNITSANGSHDIKILPDSDTDISESGREILTHLNEQLRTLMLSDVVPKTVNGTKMFPLGKLPV